MLHSECSSLATQNFAVVDDFLSAEDSAIRRLMVEQRATLEMGEIVGVALPVRSSIYRPPLPVIDEIFNRDRSVGHHCSRLESTDAAVAALACTRAVKSGVNRLDPAGEGSDGSRLEGGGSAMRKVMRWLRSISTIHKRHSANLPNLPHLWAALAWPLLQWSSR